MRSAVLAASLLAGAVACSGAPEAPPESSAPDAPPVALVSLQDLRASVPIVDGWTRGEVLADESPAPDRSTHVMVTYSRGAEKLDLQIADTGGNERAIEALEHMAGTDVTRTVDNGYFKGTTVASFPAVESWNTVDKLGELSVLIRRRYIIHVGGSGLADAAPMRALAEAVDMSRLR
jgi:hypothetical protein